MKLDAPIISAIIAAAVAVISLFIQSFINISKNRSDKQANFHKTINEKLEKIYSPLNLELGLRSAERDLITPEIKELLRKYNHLISTDLHADFTDLIRMEESQKAVLAGQKWDKGKEQEYEALRNKVKALTRKEFTELQTIDDRYFSHFKSRIASRSGRIWINIGNIIFALTIAFWASLLLFTYGKPEVILIAILVVCSLVSIVIAPRYVIKLVEYILGRVRQKTDNRHYKADDYVPETGVYLCRYCKTEHRKTKYKSFEHCPENHKGMSFFRLFMYTPFQWKKKKPMKGNGKAASLD
ncbi:hypothetical protein ACFSL6_20650 [Paenibacillus thailandensis]|uniref:DUF2207 domain-containing protein n=1 Tax=Paenibacillus thailandensis TaxID=393250 RepID=A0ABW5QYG1_9BACL